MFHQQELVFTATTLVLFSTLLSVRGNSAVNDYELILSKLDSRLNVASKMIETAKLQLHNDLRKRCQNGSCVMQVTDCSKVRKYHLDEKPQDCSDIYEAGYHSDGIYKIWPQSSISNGPLYVYCDTKDGGGWTVIQRRGGFGNPEDYFYQDWNTYKLGFGHLLREFWIGNDNLFALTSQRSYQIRFDLRDWDQDFKYAIYDEFWIDSELFNYTLHVKGYNGTAGDSLQYHNEGQFSTLDRDNDAKPSANCAARWKAAWWYKNCYRSNLNGIYLNGQHQSDRAGVNWNSFRGIDYSLMDAVMKIRPISFEVRSTVRNTVEPPLP